MDNASTHMTEEVEAAILKTGAFLIYGAPYSPHLNPTHRHIDYVANRHIDYVVNVTMSMMTSLSHLLIVTLTT